MSGPADDVVNTTGTAPSFSRSSKKRGASFVSLDIDHDQQQGGVGSGSAMDLGEVPEANMGTIDKSRFYVRLFVEHLAIQLFSIILIIADTCVTCVAIATDNDDELDAKLAKVGNVFLGYFVVEVSLRFYGIGPVRWSRSPWEIFDAAIIAVSVVCTFALKDDSAELGNLVIIGRFFRLIRLIRLIPQFRKCILSLRLTTSENKRRFREDGFDLDLTYITGRVIAMSFPSSGMLALYRNPIEEVSRFFRKYHKGHFKIYNLCSERDYEYEPFDYSVTRFMIDDHNVPTLQQMLDFVLDANRFLKKDSTNVISVHCKGGKGRTGSMICAYLMYSDKSTYPTGESARNHFADRRSDMRVYRKFQGVQTPSQCRFIDYWQEIIHTYSCVIPDPPCHFVKSIVIRSPPPVISDPKCDLLVEIWDRTKPLLSFNLLSVDDICSVELKEGDLWIEFLDHVKPCVTGDIKIRFKSPKLPIKYDKASFYFWFNSIFVRNGELHIEREMLDNPHFTKFNKIYNENFAVTIKFDMIQKQRLV